MRNSELDRLLERYYAGETTVSEEERIREILDSEDLPGLYLTERELFRVLASDEGIPAPSAGFEKSIMERIDFEEERSRISTIKRKLYSAVAVAASLLIAVSSYFIIFSNQNPRDTFTDPELAYLQTVEVLRIVSEGLNSGSSRLSDLAYIDQATENIGIFRRSNESVSKKLEPLGYLDKGLKIFEEAAGEKNIKK